MNPLVLRNYMFTWEQQRILSLYCFIYSQKSFSTKIVYYTFCQSLGRESEQKREDLEINLCYKYSWSW